MNGGDKRRRVGLSPAAHKGLHTFAAAHGITVSGFLEVVARHLAAQADRPVDELSDALRELVLQARRHDAARRRRSEPTPP